MIWKIPPLSSGGIILSYQCCNRCQHCLYACSPDWKDWISERDLDRILVGMERHSRYLTGIHIAGGEPMLRPDLAGLAVEKATGMGLPLDYLETNAFWCWNDEKTREAMVKLRDAGLSAILVSTSPFHLEFIPMDRVNRAVRIGREVFGPGGVILYTEYFYEQFQNIDPKYPLPLEDYLDAVGRERASMAFATEYALIPNGRAGTRLSSLYEHFPASRFLGDTCENELSSPHHIHVDAYGNYVSGLCAGISLGDGRDLDALYNGIDLSMRPFLDRAIRGGMGALCEWAQEKYGYRERPEGYIAKCELCLDIRRHLVDVGVGLEELRPLEFYEHLE